MKVNEISPPGRRPVGFIDKAVFGVCERWVEFWFTPADPAPLGVLRLLVGGMLIYSHWVWGLDLPAFMGTDGWNSAELIRQYQRDQWNLSFWWLIPDSCIQVVHRWCFGVLILFWAGCCTRITSLLAFAIHASCCQRAALSNYGLDQILGVLLMYLAIGPSGSDYSFDSVWRRILQWRRQRQNGTAATQSPSIGSASAGLALRLIQVHYCVIYFFSSTAKLQGESWWTGEALWNVIANYEYQSTDLTWLAWYPGVVQLATHITVLWEISFAYLVWNRTMRFPILAMGIVMHLGIGAFLGMWTFGLTMIFGYIAFVKPESVRNALRLTAGK